MKCRRAQVLRCVDGGRGAFRLAQAPPAKPVTGKSVQSVRLARPPGRSSSDSKRLRYTTSDTGPNDRLNRALPELCGSLLNPTAPSTLLAAEYFFRRARMS